MRTFLPFTFIVLSLCVQCTKISNVQRNSFSSNAPFAFPAATKVVSGGSASGVLNANDPDGDGLKFFISEDPAHGTVQISDPASGEYIYTPQPGYTGADAFAFKANDGVADSNAATVDIQVVDGVVSVVSGYAANCALTSKGQVKCWGLNISGQLGLGNTTNRGDDLAELGSILPYVDFGDVGGVKFKATALTSGYYHMCALLDNARIKCWGGNAYGTLGLGHNNQVGDQANEMGNALPFVNLGTVDNTPSGTPLKAKSIASSFYHTCAILENDRLKCWGYNIGGQLGLMDNVNRGDQSSPLGNSLPYVDLGTRNGMLYKVKSVTTAASSTCAILEDDRMKCWGTNAFGELFQGDNFTRGLDVGTMGNSLPYTDPGFNFLVKAVASRSYTYCALTLAGKLTCWGKNNGGQLGQGTLDNFGNLPEHIGLEPKYAYLGSPDARIMRSTKIVMGNAHVCALMDNGQVKCWGANTYGQLGLGDTVNRGGAPSLLTPEMYSDVQLTDGNKLRVISLSAGEDYNCAVLQDGSVKCWGRNQYGQLGLGDIKSRGSVSSEMGDALLPVPLFE